MYCYTGLFKKLGAKFVFDVQSVSDLALFECGRDFVRRFRENKVNSSEHPLPVLASACPGVIYFYFLICSLYTAGAIVL